MKKCTKCQENKNLTEFNKDAKFKDGKSCVCRLCVSLYHKKHYIENSEQIKSRRKRYYLDNRDKERVVQKQYRKNNKEKITQIERNLRKNSINYRLSNNLRCRLNLALKAQNTDKQISITKLLDCTLEEFKKYMESKFLDGMTWENHGRFGWHIDHIIPCASFDLSRLEDQQKCFHYTNLQPLWWHANLSKNKY